MPCIGVKFEVYVGHAPETRTLKALLPILKERELDVGTEDLVEVSIHVTKPDDSHYARKLRAHLKFLESQRSGR